MLVVDTEVQYIDTGGNETTGQVLSQAGFQSSKWNNCNKSFPDSIFSQLFGVPENVNYVDILGD